MAAISNIAVTLLATAMLAPCAAPAGGLPPIGATTSLLVVSPHPDDETLCCAGAIERVANAGGRVSVVWVTSGDGSMLSMLMVEKSPFAAPDKVRALASKRMDEAREATALLGVPRNQQLFLGYPDGEILQLLTANRTAPAHARFTGDTRVPYPEALFPGHPYTGESLEHDFEAILERLRPTLILAPSLEDTHPDHSATGRLVTQALLRRGEAAKLHYWIVHGGEGWPSPRGYMPGIPLGMPATGTDLRLQPFTLTDNEEARELRAVNAYRSQMVVMAPFLLAFVRTSELFSEPPTALKAP
ncbi:MAG TPA: PIG-L family deacetylase [Steroidobacteraceae bacterium]